MERVRRRPAGGGAAHVHKDLWIAAPGPDY